ncbi:bifunctional 4-hydroxy-2-oxoglutarate aldolase/2-dehydro-3-deoxy-phosphogluconate aldolase [Euhalothece natronophila Z-M001]|uniref:Bifunctional 4-hydroxy-2-oxoglutarate aldolase/2-dehydro-3-deoxy-phosphogluconate aldolase n=1 Tax=Euhalothece natronophila Z-M001 TaxID=522448 RepID=A0A5B8NQP9_9CHRO|nr:bifunctional 4-hydroxy-2-oxoglutarate aldolase/2-dehydro-3-deoxy-phosphogluconate aldolase [Euhalothece natronophila]QDZ41328.1 bifunctional 4-hydroxy-2-oxoglutarate aldolase/2-dehydro-3-deoxy-phosphogluconate aldolase [Euhalothece natronophila Z-M001]
MSKIALETFKEEQVIAVIRAVPHSLGKKLAHAMSRGGIRLIEVTWNSDQPERLISELREELPNCIIGTGTILTIEELESAIAQGAQFVFSPHVNSQLITRALEANIPIIPGALSPTEIITAWQSGATAVKVFPAQALGGVSYIKSLQGPMGNIPLIPTGGVTLENAKDFINAGATAVGLSSQLFPNSLIEAENWEEMTQRARQLKNKGRMC